MAFAGLPEIKWQIRFATPVHSESQGRARFKLMQVTARGTNEFMTKSEVVVEIGSSDEPGLVAEWLSVSYLAEWVTA
ncbi:acyl dehydratase [Bradyrhizobium sp. AZCC 1577]